MGWPIGLSQLKLNVFGKVFFEMYANRERVCAVVALFLIAAGQFNFFVTKFEILGLSTKTLSILLFIPAFILVLVVHKRGY
jgi:hypothetical protein